MPSADAAANGPRQAGIEGQGGSDLTQAFKILSLHLPRVLGASAIAPKRLLAGGGGAAAVAGNLSPYSQVFQALLQSLTGSAPDTSPSADGGSSAGGPSGSMSSGGGGVSDYASLMSMFGGGGSSYDPGGGSDSSSGGAPSGASSGSLPPPNISFGDPLGSGYGAQDSTPYPSYGTDDYTSRNDTQYI